MRYLITTNNTEAPFLTDWFEPENYFNINIGMVVYDLEDQSFTMDGVEWHPIDEDHL